MGLTLPFLLMYGSHDMRHIGFRKLTVVNGTLENWGVTKKKRKLQRKIMNWIVNRFLFNV